MFRKKFLFIIFLLGVFAFPANSFGVMSSNNYTIFADSVDSGGVLSASGTYSLEDTVGESATATSTGGTYEIISGYQAMDWSVLSVGSPAGSVNLGDLSVNTVASGAVTFLVTVDAIDGYVLSVGGTSGTSLNAVSDGAVTVGQEEYGIAVSGVDSAFADDRAITAGLNLAASSSAVVDIETIATFKAAISNNTAPGARTQGVTFAISTNL